MEQKEILSGLVLELRRGTTVLSVLSQLGAPTYGYELVSMLNAAGMPMEANTLYPLLRRLEGQGVLMSSWEMGGNKPRKYYRRTEMGDELFQSLKRIWEETTNTMKTLLEEAEHAE
ncbi:PadR family transcriptional regulator [Christensenellaceae bacterium OttesenSCG-928-L17]|nr:PadR family transcriptional regulator [Christensenellaceae bacterium OttesenSCG-928-L17]